MADEPINYDELWRKAGLDIHILIFATSEFIVFLDSQLDLDWQTTPKQDRLLDAQAASVAKVLNQVASLQSVPVDSLSKANKLNFRRMVGEAVARCLDGDCASANSMLRDAEEFVNGRNQDIARHWFLTAAFVTALAPALLGVAFWIWRDRLRSYLGVTTVNVILGCSMGALGALLSVITRMSKIPVDPSAGRALHYWEGLSRILTGVISALIIQIAIKLGFLLPSLNPYGAAGNLFTGFLAGVSEHLVSNFIKRFEMTALRSHNKR